ncbi:MAG: demethylmenaquinone methyltransferase / 2-methoxy-6-polyprenyl,4-benzoquinol methylase, partial [Actinomycetota bacterium]|nr:demethylmenaquinone methyltransferase / 2-methoxy-6-polyprenyl,4-benzoquinol methylase [Actinomycetota bacterium]
MARVGQPSARDFTGDVRDAYDVSAASWASAPEAYYRRLADALIAAAPDDAIRGARVIDVGTGTGAVGAAARTAGARSVVGTDLAFGMVRHDAADRGAGVVANALTLPFANESFDVVAAGCVLNHIAVPGDALREMARVTRAGGVVLASTFQAGPSHPAKQQIDDALATAGFRPPEWYDTFKREIEPLTATPERLLDAARAADFDAAEVVERIVDSDLSTPDALVQYRF